MARLKAQARLIAGYEESRWPRRRPRTADLIRHPLDQHGLRRADMVPILGTPGRASEVLSGRKKVEHGDGAAAARPLSRSGRCAVAAGEKNPFAPRAA